MATKLINLTPHAVHIHQTNNRSGMEIPSSGSARVVSNDAVSEFNKEIGFTVASYPDTGIVEGLPDPTPGVAYIVSLIVLGYPSVKGRTDVFSPGTGPKDGAIRSDKGQVVGVTRLIAAPK
jgi:hypothetical protein